MNRLILRADATPAMGTGHVMRCLALAQTAAEAGVDVRMACRVCVPWVRERLAQSGLPCTLLEGNPSECEQPESLREQLCRIDDGAIHDTSWVVLDGYHFTLACQQAVCQAGFRLLVIDDYAHLPEYACDILLNQNIGAETLLYAGDVGQMLLGPQYALLRSEFRRVPPYAPAARVRRLLLTLGGGDFSPWLGAIAPALRTPDMAGVELCVIAGHMRAEHIRRALHGTPATVRVLERVENMAALLRETDACITAGGSTCWELACCGVPFVTVCVAENQQRICRWLEENGYAQRCSSESVARLLRDAAWRNTLSTKLRQLVDGNGAFRVLKAIRDMRKPRLREATLEDMTFIYELANDPDVRRMSFGSEPIPWEIHKQWFHKQLVEKNPFYIVCLGMNPCGYVRMCHDTDTAAGEFLLSIAIAQHARGFGVATAALRAACSRSLMEGRVGHIHALVKENNAASLRIFTKAGFYDAGVCTVNEHAARHFIYPDYTEKS